MFGAMAGLLGATGTAYLASAAVTSSIVITHNLTTADGGTRNGAAIGVTMPTSAITASVTNGHNQLAAGLEAAQVNIASGETGTMLVNVAWLDPQDGGGVLHSPNAYILTGLYQEDASATAGLASHGACNNGEYEIAPGGTNICVEPLSGANSSGVLTKAAGDSLLQASVSGVTTAYVLLSIYVNGNAPPGQQGQTTDLRFFVSAQLA